jgi:hypothetical protein
MPQRRAPFCTPTPSVTAQSASACAACRFTFAGSRASGELRDDGWVSDAVPDAVGIALIVVGAVGSALMRKVSPAKTEATERQ